MKKILLLSIFIFSSLCMTSQVLFWAAKPTNFSTPLFSNQVSYADSTGQVVWITGSTGAATDTTQKFSRSIDGGNTWVSGNIGLGNAALSISSIEAISATKAYVAVNAANGGIWVTNDSGVTWTKQTTASFSSADSFADFVTFFSPLEGVAVGDPVGGYFEIYTTVDGGTVWTRVPSASIPVPLVNAAGATEAAYTRLFKRVGNTVWFGSSQGRIFRSNNKGLTWQAFASPIPDFGTTASNGSFAFKDDNNGILINQDTTQWSTIDGGVTWNQDSPNGLTRDGAVCFVPGTTNTYINTGTDLVGPGSVGSSYSTDGGLNWEDINILDDPLDVTVGIEVEFANPTQGLASGSNNNTSRGIFKYVGSLLPNKTFSSDKLFSVSPNPTNGLMKLTGVNINQVQITDILGKVIANNSYDSLSNVDLNISEYNSGIYLVKVANNEGQTSVVKVVKQ